MNKPDTKSKSDFEAAGKRPANSLLREFVQFVVENKKWWLIPILVSLAAIGILIFLSSTGAAPFIYTLF